MKSSEIATSLRELGLKKGDIVMLHSSLISLGHVEGGADAVIDAFLDVIGKKGTLLTPVFGALGIIPDTLKRRKGALVSSCPASAVAALGADAEELIRDHWKAETAHGEDTPYTRLAEKGGYICLLGVDQDRNTSLHSVEALLKLPYLSTISRTIRTPDGTETAASWKYFPGPHRDFIGLDRVLLDSGAMTMKVIGNSQVRLIRSALLFETLLPLGAEDPAFALCNNPACADCVRQRAAIYASEIAKEPFRLSVSSRLAGRYVPEITEHMKRAGLSFLELDYLQGKACAFLPVKTLKRAVEELAEAGIQVSALRVPALPDTPDQLCALVKECGIPRVILPLAENSECAEHLSKKGVAISFSHGCRTALQTGKLLSAARASVKGGLVFNGADFVAAGEMPFLQSYRAGRFVKSIDQLDLVDCKWDGEPAALCCGNSEIKELVSILRCHNFRGFFVLGGGVRYPGTLMDAVEDFQNIMNTI